MAVLEGKWRPFWKGFRLREGLRKGSVETMFAFPLPRTDNRERESPRTDLRERERDEERESREDRKR